MRHPVFESVLLVLASCLMLSVMLASSSPWLAPELRPLAHILAGAWLAWRLIALDRALAHRRAWTTSTTWSLAPDALAHAHPHGVQMGLLLGQAFRWTGTQTQVLETALAAEGALPVAEGSRGGHPALHAIGQRNERPLVLPWDELVSHTLLTGTTRSGKTRELEVLASEAIRGPGAVVVVDPKGDRELLARCAAEARRQSRRFVLITPAFPQQSATMNVLDTATTPVEVATRIQALMPSAGGRPADPFFTEYPLPLIEHIAAVQQALGLPCTLRSLYSASVLRIHLEQLLATYLLSLGGHTPGKLSALIGEYRKSGKTDLIADGLIDDLEKPRDHFTRVTSNLIPAFRGMIHAPLGPLFSTIPASVTWDTVVQDNMVLYLGLASMLIGDIANRIGRVILQDLVGFLGRRHAYSDMTLEPPITIFIDELRDVVSPTFVNALNKGGGAKARFVLCQQSEADMESVLGPALARVAQDNLNTKIYFRLGDDNRTAKNTQEGLGLCTVQLPETGVGLAYGGTGGLSGSSHRRLTNKEVSLVRAQWLTALPRGEFFLRMKGEIWKGRTPLLTPIPQSTLQALGLSALWDSMKPHP